MMNSLRRLPADASFSLTKRKSAEPTPRRLRLDRSISDDADIPRDARARSGGTCRGTPRAPSFVVSEPIQNLRPPGPHEPMTVLTGHWTTNWTPRPDGAVSHKHLKK